MFNNAKPNPTLQLTAAIAAATELCVIKEMTAVDSIQVLQSNKTGLNSKESYVVTRGKTSFLRILGCDPQWELMTATASEDHGRIRACGDQRRLIEAAFRLGAEINTKPIVENDWKGREYVKICGITQEPSQSDTDFTAELQELFRKFFEYYDGYRELSIRGDDEMHELYNALTIDDQGGDVYLSDGVWLSSDGSTHDRGR